MENRLNNLFESYIHECKFTRRMRSETLRGYSNVFTAFSRIVPEVIITNNLTQSMINTFFERLQTRTRIIGRDKKVQGVRDSTVKTYWSKLNSFFNWLESKGHIEKNPLSLMAKPPEPQYEDDRALTEDNVKRIIASVSSHNSDAFLMNRDMAMFNTLLYTGVRKGELLGLEIQDMNFEKQEILIRAITSKSKKNRTIPMNPTLIMHLKIYLEQRKKKGYKTASLWVSSTEDKGLSSHGLKHWVTRYNILSGVRFHLHRFRHTFACSLVEAGVHIVKIQKLMGHKDITMTQQYLRSINTDDCRDDVNKLNF